MTPNNPQALEELKELTQYIDAADRDECVRLLERRLPRPRGTRAKIAEEVD